jgi:hypothetical protein
MYTYLILELLHGLYITGYGVCLILKSYRITAVLKVETDIITSITSSLITETNFLLMFYGPEILILQVI